MRRSYLDIPLKENDVLFVATKTEKMSDRTLTIRGEVQYPGVYKYADNETVEDFIIQAGGLTDKASLMNVSISRRVSDPKALRPDSVIAKTFNVALKNYRVDPSQGTHFFQNLTSFGVGYFTVDTNRADGGLFRKDLLDLMPAVEETRYVRHVRFSSPLRIMMDGKKQEGVVLVPQAE